MTSKQILESAIEYTNRVCDGYLTYSNCGVFSLNGRHGFSSITNRNSTKLVNEFLTKKCVNVSGSQWLVNRFKMLGRQQARVERLIVKAVSQQKFDSIQRLAQIAEKLQNERACISSGIVRYYRIAN